MIKKISFAVVAIIIGIIVFQSKSKMAISYDGGAPSGYSNDPAGGNVNCTACHNGTVTSVSGWITSNIPVTGYLPNTTYQITATSTGTTGNKGFEISAQSTSGVFKGTLIAGTGTKIVGTNYITNSGSGITTNPMIWTFNWTSPASGQGPVTFYGAFVIGKKTIKTTTYTVVQSSSTGISESQTKPSFSVYPNPVKEKLNVNYSLTMESNVEINLFSIDGKKSTVLLTQKQQAGIYNEVFDMKNKVSQGMYLLEIKIAGKSTIQKLMVE